MTADKRNPGLPKKAFIFRRFRDNRDLAAVGLAKNAEWGRRLAIGVLAVNLVGDSLNALLRHDPITLIGLPIGGLMIWYLLKTKRDIVS